MSIAMTGEQVNGNHMLAFQVQFQNVSLTAGTNQGLYIQPDPANLQVGFWVAPFAGQLIALTSYSYLSSGTTTGSLQYRLLSASSSAVSGTGSNVGSFSAVAGVTTNAITPATIGGGTNVYGAVWTQTPKTPITFTAGTVFEIQAVPTVANISNLNANASLIVASFV